MNDFQRVKSENFVTIANEFLKDKNLSNKAKGVLAMILALPDNWDFSIKGMVSITKDGEASLRSAINEMKENGYCAMKPVRINNKIARWKYLFSGEKLTEELLCDFLQVEKLQVENQAQYNNKEINNLNNNSYHIDNLSDTNVSSKQQYDSDFLEFWKLYDYPKDKKTAYSRWKHLSKKDKESAVKAIPSYFEDCARCKRSKQHPATYLSKRTFEDSFTVQGKIAFYDAHDFDSDEVKRFKNWMRNTYPEVENTALPLSYEDYMRLIGDSQEYVTEVSRALDEIVAEIWKYRKSDIASVIKDMLGDERRD